MRNFKKFGALAVAILALSAIGAASAPAATFTASETGSLSGKALENQVLTTNGGTANCTTAAMSGTISKTADTQQEVSIKSSGCTAFGFATVHFSDMTLLFTAGTGNNTHILNTITITPTFIGTSMCTVTITPQTVGGSLYTNISLSRWKVQFQLTGINYHSTGSSCGSSGTNGTLTGSNEISRVGGGSVQYDA